MISGLSAFQNSPAAMFPFGALARGFHPEETASVFAQEVARRAVAGVEAVAGTEASGSIAMGNTALGQDDAEGGSAGSAEQRARLASALEGAVQHVAGEYGDKAGTAFMGLVIKRLGSGPVTEETLGNGLLDGLRFIDRQFGTEAGDELMDKFNGDLNHSLNDFFGNGLSEQFIAVSSKDGIGAVPLPHMPEGEEVDLVKSMLDALQEARKQEASVMAAKTAGTASTGNGALPLVHEQGDMRVAGAAGMAYGVASSPGGYAASRAKGPLAGYGTVPSLPSGVLLNTSV